MKAIQTLLVRKRKWKTKAKPVVVSKATDQRGASLIKEGECSVLQVCEACARLQTFYVFPMVLRNTS